MKKIARTTRKVSCGRSFRAGSLITGGWGGQSDGRSGRSTLFTSASGMIRDRLMSVAAHPGTTMKRACLIFLALLAVYLTPEARAGGAPGARPGGGGDRESTTP